MATSRTWTIAGLAAYATFKLGQLLLGDELAWDAAGRWLAGAVLILAAAYELTPFKDVCLGKCRSPLAFLLGSWRSGTRGALHMGAQHGAWCVGCCWALMASLFALGVMSLAWMAFIAALIALEKTLPFRRTITYTTADAPVRARRHPAPDARDDSRSDHSRRPQRRRAMDANSPMD